MAKNQNLNIKNQAAQNQTAQLQAEQDQATQNSGKKKHFVQGLLLYFLIGLVVIVVGLIIFYQYLGSYENSRAQNVADEYMASVTEEDFRELILSRTDLFPVTEFEKSEDIAVEVFSALEGSGRSIRRAVSESTEESPAFTIRLGSCDFATLHLKINGDAGFDLNTWAVDKVTLNPSVVPATRTLSITAPTEWKVSINGVQVPEKYLQDTWLFEGLTDLELGFEDPLTTSLYVIDGIYSNVEVEVTDREGNIVLPATADGVTYLYQRPDQSHTVTIQAVTGTEVVMNGLTISEEYITETELATLMEGIEAYAPGFTVPEMTTYVVPGIYETNLQVEGVIGEGTGGEETVTETLPSVLRENGEYAIGWDTGLISEEQRAIVNSFMDLYVRYNCNLNDDVEYHWGNLKPYLLKGSDLYSRMQQLYDSLMWVRSYSLNITGHEIVSYVAPSENTFLVRVTSSYNLEKGDQYIEETASFDILFVQNEGEWLAARMSIVR